MNNLRNFEEWSTNEKKGNKLPKDPFKKGTKPPKDPNEITAEGMIEDLMKKTGLSKEDVLKKLQELKGKLERLKEQEAK